MDILNAGFSLGCPLKIVILVKELKMLVFPLVCIDEDLWIPFSSDVFNGVVYHNDICIL